MGILCVLGQPETAQYGSGAPNAARIPVKDIDRLAKSALEARILGRSEDWNVAAIRYKTYRLGWSSDVDAVQLLEACIQMGTAVDGPALSVVPTIWDDNYVDDDYVDDGHSLGDPGGVAMGECLSPLDAWDYAW